MSSTPEPTPPRAVATQTDWDGTRDEIVKLRCLGKGKGFIAAALGLTQGEVDRILKQEFNTRLGVRQEMIENAALELEFIKAKVMVNFDKFGDRRDAEVLLKVIDRKCKLFGLDAPVKHEVKIEDLSDADLERELARNNITTTLKSLPEPVEDAEYAIREGDTGTE